MATTAKTSFRRESCIVIGDGGTKHNKELKSIGEKLCRIGLKCIEEFENENPSSNIVGKLVFKIEDMGEFKLNNEHLCSCFATAKKDYSDLSALYENPDYEHTENYFYASEGRRLERISIQMGIFDANKLLGRERLENELEARIIKAFLALLPYGNRYLDDISRRARHSTARSYLIRHGCASYEAFSGDLVKYGFSPEIDGRMLESIWAKFGH